MNPLAQPGNLIPNQMETAYLVVSDYRALCQGQSAEDGQSLIASVCKAARDALKAGVPKDQVPQGKTDRYLKVQFNPSELQIQAATNPINRLDAQKPNAVQQSVSDVAEAGSLTLSLSLYFDDACAGDAFRADQLSANLSSAYEKAHTVQPQVEGLVAALRNPFTRGIAFHWADFVFEGQLTSVEAHYLMFSTSGRPVRASVALQIQQELTPEKLACWYRDLSTSFQ